MNKSKNCVPGILCALHTFVRPLEWNPHIHCFITEDGFSDENFWRVVKHFNYTLLRNSFQTALLNELEHRIVPSFKKTKDLICPKDKNGIYVYSKPNLCDTNTVIKYIRRYLVRPVIALKRIDSYDGKNVTLHYNCHENDASVGITLPALDFMACLFDTSLKRTSE